MAWVDDRIYCHPRVLSVSKPARWTFVAGIAYSAGWGTGGFLNAGAQEAIGADKKLRAELVAAELWATLEDGSVQIRDWDEHNDKRDKRRERERQRKRDARAEGRWKEADRTPLGRSLGRAPGEAPACVEGSEGSEEELSKAVMCSSYDEQRPSMNNEQVRHLIDASLKEAS